MKIFIITILFSFIFISSSFAQTVLWKESFDNNDLGWIVGTDNENHSSIKDGHYKLQHKVAETNWCFYNASSIDPNKDYTIEIKLKLTEGPDNYGYGMYLIDDRNSKNKKEYFFNISGNKQFSISKYANEADTYYREWEENEIITGYNEYNTLSVKKSGSKVSFFINQVKVHEQSNIDFFGSQIGFILWDKLTVLVDYIEIRQDKGKIRLAQGSETPLTKENLGAKVNSPYDDIMPVISPDGKTLFYNVKQDPANIGGNGTEEYDDIWYTTLGEDGNWSNRKNIGSPLNNTDHNFLISIMPDNNTLILGNTYDSKGNFLDVGISKSQKTKKGWSMPENLSIDNYYTNAPTTSNCMTADGKVILLDLEREDGYGGHDLYVSFQKKNGNWTEPKNLGPMVNTYGYDMAPFMAADGKSLYYSTNGKTGYGDNDIFVTKRLDDTWTNWSEPENLGPYINTKSWDAYYTIPASGEYAYIVSNENSIGKGDIFRIKLPETKRPEPVVIIYGKVLNKADNKPIEATITYHDLKSNKEIGMARSNPQDGSYKIVLPYGTEYGFQAVKNGFFAESDHIDLTGVKSYQEIERNLFLNPIEIGKNIVLKNVFFERGLPVLLETSYPELERLVKLLNDNPTLKIEISGHTDNQGNEDLNLKLSNERVTVIKNYLTSKGVASSRLSGKGYGESKPIASNDTEDTRKLNRRVEFKIIQK